MPNDFEIENGLLKKYHGTDANVIIPDNVTEIGKSAFSGNESLISVVIPDGVTEISDYAFNECKNLTSVSIPDSVKKIGEWAFNKCKSLSSVTLPDGLTEIGDSGFRECSKFRTVTIPGSITDIGYGVFNSIGRLQSIVIPDSVTDIKDGAFDFTPSVTFICGEGSYTHQYCLENKRPFIFDYQYEAFHGLLPQGFKKLASPFLADEEKPFIFISYSHKARDTVLPILKTLYEDGWKIWYDEGLTIGDRYDETLEEHVRNCTAFLLFVSENSVNSYYCRENEIPWANKYGKPIIRCDLDEKPEFEPEGAAAAATVTRTEIGPALEQISGLTRGERREAKGITVVVDPADRDGAEGDGFAYCFYTEEHAAAAKAIMLEARNSGCTLYDAVEGGADEEKLQSCACLIVFLDKAFLADKALTKTLTEAYQAGRDIAVCQVESISNNDLPQELLTLHKMQWLHFAHGINADMNRKLARHLQKRGCRNTATLPGFEYEKTDSGIVIKRYTGLDPNPRIERGYGGIPVVEIAEEAFKNCAHLKTIVIPDSVKTIGDDAFRECVELSSVTIPESVTKIGRNAFYECASLTSVTVPGSVKIIERETFNLCTHMKTATLSEGVEEIGNYAFTLCMDLTSLSLPNSLKKIGREAFYTCRSLTALTIPDSVTEIDGSAFSGCPNLTITCSPDSYARKFCEEHNIPSFPVNDTEL